jgi:hypothetical protein
MKNPTHIPLWIQSFNDSDWLAVLDETGWAPEEFEDFYR